MILIQMIHNSDFGETTGIDHVPGQGYSFDNDPDAKEQGTIDSTARTMQRVRDGKLTEEDLNACLESNAKNIGVSVEHLKGLAERELARQNTESDTSTE